MWFYFQTIILNKHQIRWHDNLLNNFVVDLLRQTIDQYAIDLLFLLAHLINYKY